MEQETIIITTGKKSSCLKETKFGGDPKSDCISVHIGYPETVTEFEGHPHLYTESEVKAERLAGQYEAWALAQKILELPGRGGYSVKELREIFDNDSYIVLSDIIRSHSFPEAMAKIQAWEEKQAKIFHVGDVITLNWGGGEVNTAVVTYVMPNLLTIVLPDGNTDTVNKSRCTKTGKTIDIEMLLNALKQGLEDQ